MSHKTKTKPKKKSLFSGKPQARKSGRRPGIFWWVIGAAATLGCLIYFFVISPGKSKIKSPDASTLNILLITLDTTRADHLGCYGYPRAKTPSLDGLAREGIRFARVYCPAPVTLPSHISILSGLYPIAHGVRNNGHHLQSGIKTLPEILKGRGYATAAFVSSFSVDSRFGIDRGFDVYGHDADYHRRSSGVLSRSTRGNPSSCARSPARSATATNPVLLPARRERDLAAGRSEKGEAEGRSRRRNRGRRNWHRRTNPARFSPPGSDRST